MAESVRQTPSIQAAEQYIALAEGLRKEAAALNQTEPAAARLVMDAALLYAQIANAAATLQVAGMNRGAPMGDDQLDYLNKITNRLTSIEGILGKYLPQR